MSLVFLLLLASKVALGTGCNATTAASNRERNAGSDESLGARGLGYGPTIILASAPGSPATTTPMPLTTARLRAIATAQGVGAGLIGIAFNRAVGVRFEHWVLSSLGLLPRNTSLYPSPARAAVTGGLPRAVIPEQVRPINVVRWAFFTKPYPGSSFYEVKAVNGIVGLSHSRYQILGLIDVAALSPAGMSPGKPKGLRPIVTFVTTGDTVIGPDVLAEATRRGVAVWQAIVLEAPSMLAMNSVLSIGPFVPLNPAVYTPVVPPASVPKPHMPGTLTSPLGLPVTVPADPDPPEVVP